MNIKLQLRLGFSSEVGLHCCTGCSDHSSLQFKGFSLRWLLQITRCYTGCLVLPFPFLLETTIVGLGDSFHFFCSRDGFLRGWFWQLSVCLNMTTASRGNSSGSSVITQHYTEGSSSNTIHPANKHLWNAFYMQLILRPSAVKGKRCKNARYWMPKRFFWLFSSCISSFSRKTSQLAAFSESKLRQELVQALCRCWCISSLPQPYELGIASISHIFQRCETKRESSQILFTEKLKLREEKWLTRSHTGIAANDVRFADSEADGLSTPKAAKNDQSCA